MAADARSRGRQSRGDHRLRDPRHPHAGARHDDRQHRAAVHPGQRLGEPGSDQLGADLLYRRGRDHDAADRLPRRPVRAQASVPRLGGRLHRRLDAVRHGAVAGADRAVPRPARHVRRGARPALAIRAARHLSEGAPGICDGVIWRRGHGRPRPRPGARRLAHRELHLALGFLHQPADRRPRLARHHQLPAGDRRETPARSWTGSASAP